ncbi:MAG: RluA family pseudouridine synthase [Chloroflexi bacterium]|nr:RluA family pseudouridine synthase [Chloroflexota bacterium]
MDRRQLRVPPTAAGERLDRFVSEHIPELTRSQARRIIERGLVTSGGEPLKASAKVASNQLLDVAIPPPEPLSIRTERLPIDVVYEDDDILVVDKAAGMVVHPAPGHTSGTLANAVLGYWRDALPDETVRPGIVHRLDKDTSGLLVVARHQSAQASLVLQMKLGHMRKVYRAVVRGRPPESGVIDAPIGRHVRDRKLMTVTPTGRPARTRFRTLEYFSGYTYVEAELETGRTHQIRVHFRSIGHPLLGDRTYGVVDPAITLRRQFLHASLLGLRLPSTGAYREFVSALPGDLEHALARLRETRPVLG